MEIVETFTFIYVAKFHQGNKKTKNLMNCLSNSIRLPLNLANIFEKKKFISKTTQNHWCESFGSNSTCLEFVPLKLTLSFKVVSK